VESLTFLSEVVINPEGDFINRDFPRTVLVFQGFDLIFDAVP
jgi:hypothetical protein